MDRFFPEGKLINTKENIFALSDAASLFDAMKKETILESRVLTCDSGHNLHLDLGGIKAVIPREEGSVGIREGTVRDIALISRVNRPVSFIVKEIIQKNDKFTAILSRRAAQEKCLSEYINTLLPGDVINARITHLEPFGAFADIGCGIVSLIPIDGISVSRIEHPKERFYPDMDVKVIIKNTDNNKITLSHKELLGTWEENVAEFSQGHTVAGVIRSVESYGIFVELTPNLAGLAESKPDVFPGQQASVYIKSIIPDRMKIKLIIIDSFESEYRPKPPEYFFTGSHMDKFCYSPKESLKQIITEF